jgi:hypothetical protein
MLGVRRQRVWNKLRTGVSLQLWMRLPIRHEIQHGDGHATDEEAGAALLDEELRELRRDVERVSSWCVGIG